MMKKGERIKEIENFYIQGFIEIVYGAIKGEISKKEFYENYEVVCDSLKSYVKVFRGWKKL